MHYDQMISNYYSYKNTENSVSILFGAKGFKEKKSKYKFTKFIFGLNGLI